LNNLFSISLEKPECALLSSPLLRGAGQANKISRAIGGMRSQYLVYDERERT